jgi:hypothetical protein
MDKGGWGAGKAEVHPCICRPGVQDPCLAVPARRQTARVEAQPACRLQPVDTSALLPGLDLTAGPMHSINPFHTVCDVLASATPNATCCLWHASASQPPGELLASYRGHTHTGVKMGCALMPGDAFVVGASEDGARAQHCCWLVRSP